MKEDTGYLDDIINLMLSSEKDNSIQCMNNRVSKGLLLSSFIVAHL